MPLLCRFGCLVYFAGVIEEAELYLACGLKIEDQKVRRPETERGFIG